MSYLLDPRQLEIHIDILFCMATHKAEVNICKNLDEFLEKRGYDKVKYHIHVVQPLDDSLSKEITDDPVLMKVLEKPQYFQQDLKNDRAYNGKADSAKATSTSSRCSAAATHGPQS